MKQKKEEKILATTISLLTVLSLIGTYMGVSNLIRLGTTMAYSLLAVIAIPVVLMIGGVLFIALNKEMISPKRDKALTFTSANFIALVFIGNYMVVFYLIKMGAIWAYIASAIIVCVVVYLAYRAVKSSMGDKSLPYK
ncbi:MAG: hypothetical protein GX857_13085 [Bacteroidales bacterium]|nr:hypothetical protein [Bacteroidales bacterium]